jgi:hypothetical protein
MASILVEIDENETGIVLTTAGDENETGIDRACSVLTTAGDAINILDGMAQTLQKAEKLKDRLFPPIGEEMQRETEHDPSTPAPNEGDDDDYDCEKCCNRIVGAFF